MLGRHFRYAIGPGRHAVGVGPCVDRTRLLDRAGWRAGRGWRRRRRVRDPHPAIGGAHAVALQDVAAGREDDLALDRLHVLLHRGPIWHFRYAIGPGRHAVGVGPCVDRTRLLDRAGWRAGRGWRRRRRVRDPHPAIGGAHAVALQDVAAGREDDLALDRLHVLLHRG